MAEFPHHLTWKEITCILKKLGYQPSKHKKRGSARDFVNTQREPAVVTLHEPHGNDTIPRGTIGLYINKLKLTKEQFLELLEDC